jgi:hypothetical protein
MFVLAPPSDVQANVHWKSPTEFPLGDPEREIHLLGLRHSVFYGKSQISMSFLDDFGPKRDCRISKANFNFLDGEGFRVEVKEGDSGLSISAQSELNFNGFQATRSRS